MVRASASTTWPSPASRQMAPRRHRLDLRWLQPHDRHGDRCLRELLHRRVPHLQGYDCAQEGPLHHPAGTGGALPTRTACRLVLRHHSRQQRHASGRGSSADDAPPDHLPLEQWHRGAPTAAVLRSTFGLDKTDAHPDPAPFGTRPSRRRRPPVLQRQPELLPRTDPADAASAYKAWAA
jgi:hypothetical protein